MAYDDQRSYARPALQSVVHADNDGRRMHGREQSASFQYTNRAPIVRGGLPPASAAYAPAGPTHMAGPSRRPLPTPRARPESMPPPLRQSPLVVQAPAPSRPAILASSAALAASPTAPPARRPLPTPGPSTKHTSTDLIAGSTAPAKAVTHPNPDRDLRIPSSISRRAALPSGIPVAPLPNPHPTWPRSPRSDAHETHESKVPPFWVPSTSSASIGPSVIERRSTVSGVPLPRPGPHRAESLERAQPAQRLPSSPPHRPLPSSPTEPPRVPSLHQRVPASSEDEHEISSPSDISSLSDQDEYEPMTFAVPMLAEDDEYKFVFATNTHTRSPQYGIRDLPTRSRIAIANRDDSQNVNPTISGAQQEQTTRAPPRSETLSQSPIPGSSTPQGQPQITSLPQSPRARMSPPVPSVLSSFSDRNSTPGASTVAPQSLTLRLASMGLAEERERERERQTKQEISSPTLAQSPIRAALSPTSPVRQQQGRPANMPPLPRTPGNASRPFFGTTDVSRQSQSIKSNGTSSPPPASLPASPTHQVRSFSSSPIFNAAFDRKSFAQQSPRQQPLPQPQQASQQSERQLQKQRARDADIDLDDAPPPSLRRSPSPIRQAFTRTPAIEITNDTPPRRQWAPGHDVTPRTGNATGNGMSNPYVAYPAGSGEWGQPLTQPPAQSSTQAQQTVVPRISLPDVHHNGDSNVDNDAVGPSIVVSGSGSSPSVSVSAPDAPAISISEVPSVTVSEHRVPAVSVSAANSTSIAFSPPKISVSDSVQPQRLGSSPSTFGSRHTQIQESSPAPSAPSRGGKRGLPSPPSSSSPMRTNGLSCGGCNGPIIGRIVSAMGERWHPNCFRCTICNELLEHVSSYEHDGRPYCHLDYHETFAPRCFHCKTSIIDERFVTLDDPALGRRTYHEQHFFCAECGDPFLAPTGPLPPSVARTGELNFAGDGEFADDDVGFTVYRGHPYCEACHVRLRMPKCKACKKSIRDGVRAVEALGGKWCWGCFVCEGCKKPFEDPSFFLRNEKPFCEPCFSLILRNDV